jgi:hypothetical protein
MPNMGNARAQRMFSPRTAARGAIASWGIDMRGRGAAATGDEWRWRRSPRHFARFRRFQSRQLSAVCRADSVIYARAPSSAVHARGMPPMITTMNRQAFSR